MTDHTTHPTATSSTAHMLEAVTNQLRNRLVHITDQVNALVSERQRITQALALLDDDAPATPQPTTPAAAPATPAATSTRTPRGKQPALKDVIFSVLHRSTEPLTARQITDAVAAAGYHSTASNFRQVIYVALSKHFKRSADGKRWQLAGGKRTSTQTKTAGAR